MARPGGNPDFGTKYKTVADGEKPLSKKQFQIRLPQENYDELMGIPRDERLALVREAIAHFLVKRKELLRQTEANTS